MKKSYLMKAFNTVALFTVLNFGTAALNRASAQTVDPQGNRIENQTKPWSNDAEYQAKLAILKQTYEANLAKVEARAQQDKANEDRNYANQMSNAARDASRQNKSILDRVSSGIGGVSAQRAHRANVQRIQAQLELSQAQELTNFLKNVENLDKSMGNDQRYKNQTSSAKLTNDQIAYNKALEALYQKHCKDALAAGFKPYTPEEFKVILEKKSQEQRQQKKPSNNNR